MSNFDVDFSKAQRDSYHADIAVLIARTPGAAITAAQFDALLRVVLGHKRVAVDDAQLTSEDREYSRALNVDGYPNAPEYRHEFLMDRDSTYEHAWAYDHTEGQNVDFKAQADAEPNLKAIVDLGHANHTYLENDEGIVDRSLLRNKYRLPREGETEPPPVTGRYAPRYTVVMPSIVNQSVVPEQTVTY